MKFIHKLMMADKYFFKEGKDKTCSTFSLPLIYPSGKTLVFPWLTCTILNEIILKGFNYSYVPKMKYHIFQAFDF